MNFFVQGEGVLDGSLRVEVTRCYHLRHRRNAGKMNESILFEFELHRRIGIDVYAFLRSKGKNDFSRSTRFQLGRCQMNRTVLAETLHCSRAREPEISDNGSNNAKRGRINLTP